MWNPIDELTADGYDAQFGTNVIGNSFFRSAIFIETDDIDYIHVCIRSFPLHGITRAIPRSWNQEFSGRLFKDRDDVVERRLRRTH